MPMVAKFDLFRAEFRRCHRHDRTTLEIAISNSVQRTKGTELVVRPYLEIGGIGSESSASDLSARRREARGAYGLFNF